MEQLEPEFYTKTTGKLSNGGAEKIIFQIRLLGFLAFIIGAFGLWFLVVTLNEKEEWAPLLDFPEQTVLSVSEDFVDIVGTKCYAEPVTVKGTVTWEAIEPRGTVFQVFEGQATHTSANFDDTGCITQAFSNEVPDQVKARPDIKLWVVAGIETPIADQHGAREGLPLSWTSEPFQYPPVIVEK